MPNMTGQYNFHELCQEAQASAPWIKKVQRLLKLEEGVKGARTYYSAEQVHIYSSVKKLRLLDIEFEEIKNIYFLEKALMNISQGHFYPKTNTNENGTEINLFIHCLPGTVFVPLDSGLNNEKKIKILAWNKEYDKILVYLRTKAEKIRVIVNEVSQAVQKIAEEYERNNLKANIRITKEK